MKLFAMMFLLTVSSYASAGCREKAIEAAQVRFVQDSLAVPQHQVLSEAEISSRTSGKEVWLVSVFQSTWGETISSAEYRVSADRGHCVVFDITRL